MCVYCKAIINIKNIKEYGTAQPQGNKGSQVALESLASGMQVALELLASRSQIISFHSCNSINCFMCFMVVNLL